MTTIGWLLGASSFSSCEEDWRRWVIYLDCHLNGKNNPGDSRKGNFEATPGTIKASQKLHIPLKKAWCWISTIKQSSLAEKALKMRLFSPFYASKHLFKHFVFRLKAQKLPNNLLQTIGTVAMPTLSLKRPPQYILAIGAEVFDLQFSSQDLLCKSRLV